MKDCSYIRVGALVPKIKIGSVSSNAQEIISLIEANEPEESKIMVFPELCLTGYSCQDLFRQKVLLDSALQALIEISHKSQRWNSLILIGLPLYTGGSLYNCAALIHQGSILGVVPKTYIPNSKEFYEQRWFKSGAQSLKKTLLIDNKEVPFGTDILFQSKENPLLCLGIEICEDLWAPLPPSTYQSLAGASIILNPSASNELAGKASYRRALCSQQSARTLGAYVYASAGIGESTTDTVYGGHTLIYENGIQLGEGPRFSQTNEVLFRDIDLDLINHERLNSATFDQSQLIEQDRLHFRTILFSTQNEKQSAPEKGNKTIKRFIDTHPFVPSNPEKKSQRCQEIFAIQASGLMARLQHIGCTQVVLGLSGGLDSTLALLVTAEAFKRLNLDLKGLHCYTMPGFGTTGRTKSNAQKLCEQMGIPIETVDIKSVCTLQMSELEHSGEPSDVAYENVQARQRTVFLMNKANMIRGIVIGTGDLSELALGWCTYNGDHMSMYAVNTGVPKTLVQYLVSYVADLQDNKAISQILYDIIDTPISPELLPPDKTDNITQKTEDLIGPYELHDFFLYYLIRCGFTPKKVLALAEQGFKTNYPKETIKKWLRHFIWRFFSQQFKRSCLPDGPKVGTIALSPRGDWRMSSDSSCQEWIKELETP